MSRKLEENGQKPQKMEVVTAKLMKKPFILI